MPRASPPSITAGNGAAAPSPPAALAVLVVGMHRSGTSAMSGVLALLGVAASEDQHPADQHNPKGYFESQRIIDFHEALLAKLGSPSNDPLPLDYGWLRSPLGAAAVAALVPVLDEAFACRSLCLFKDPRLCRLVPVWTEALARSGRRGVAILPFRHPLEVASSLQDKAGLSRAYALTMWLQHVVYGERFTRGTPRSFNGYDRLLDNWRGVVGKIGRELDLAWPTDVMRAAPSIDVFLSRELRHHHMEQDRLEPLDPLDALCSRAWDALRLLEADPVHPRGEAEMDAVAGALEAGVGVLGPLVVSYQQALDASRRDADQLVGETEAIRQAVAYRDGVILQKEAAAAEGRQELENTRVTLRRRFEQAERDLGAVRLHLHQTHLALAERDETIIEREEMTAADAHELAALSAVAVNAIARVQSMETSTSWRASHGLRMLLARSPGLRVLIRSTANLVWRAATLKLGRRPVSTGIPVAGSAMEPDLASEAVETEALAEAAGPERAAPRPLHIVFLSGEPDTPGHNYRVVRYAEAARSLGAAVEVVRFEQAHTTLDIFRQADLVFVWRARWDKIDVGPAIEAAEAAGAVVVFDIDDLIFDPALAQSELIDGLRSGGHDAKTTREYFGDLQRTLIAADYATAPTAALAQAMRGHHKRPVAKQSFVLPNGFDEDALRRSRHAARAWRQTPTDNLIRIGYATGSRTHQHDFDQSAAAVAQILREHPECRLTLFRNAREEVLYLAEFPDFDGLTERIEWRNLVPFAEVPTEMARFDINLAPLEVDNLFCESKSELKYYEAALVDVPTIASPTEPYRLAIRDGETGFLARTQDEWYAALKRLVVDAGLRKRMARAAFYDAIVRYGPERRAEQFQSLLDQTLGNGRRGARAFALDLARQRQPAAATPFVPEHAVVFEADRLRVSPVTVTIPLHNYARFVVEALDSVAAQSLEDLDLVVVDDASTDGSLEAARVWMEAHQDRFNRVVLVRNLENAGLAFSRNAGFALAESPYVLPLDADNRLLPDCAERLLEAIAASGAAFAYPLSRQFGDLDLAEDTQVPDVPSVAERLVRRTAWAAVGGYDGVTSASEDSDFADKLGEGGWFVEPVDAVLAEHRHAQRSATAVPPAPVPTPVAPAADSAADRPPRVVFLSGDPDGPGHARRVANFAEAARSLGAVVEVVRFDKAHTALDSFRQADLVFVWRAAWDEHDVGPAIVTAEAGGALVVFDIDDLSIDPNLPLPSTEGDSPVQLQVARDHSDRLQRTLVAADYASAPTAALAQYLQRYSKLAYNKLSFQLSDGFDEADLRQSRLIVRTRSKHPSDGLIRIGHLAPTRQLAPAAAAVSQVLREHPKCRLVLFGTEAADLLDLGVMPGFEASLDQVEWVSPPTSAEVPTEMARFDINLAPLEVDNLFCESKSELKYYEAALVDVPTIASPTEPYRLAIRDGETGFLARTQDEWYAALKRLVVDAGLRKRMARAAFYDAIVRYGPERRAEQFQSLLDQTLGNGRRGARAFALDLARQRQPAAATPFVPEHAVVFEADRLRVSPVTVTIPLHNYARFVVEALDSVAAQSLEDLDLVVVDDASTDGSLEAARVWMEAHQDRFNRVVLVRNLENAGLAFSRNAGFALAESPYVLPLDADNRLLPDCAERLLEAIAASGAAFAYPLSRQFGDLDLAEDTQPLGVRPYAPARLLEANYIDAMALVRRMSWAAAGGYDHIRLGWEDYDFWCKLAEQGWFGQQVPEILAEYRVHAQSMLRSTTNLEANKISLIKTIEDRHPWLRIEETRRPWASIPAAARPLVFERFNSGDLRG